MERRPERPAAAFARRVRVAPFFLRGRTAPRRRAVLRHHDDHVPAGLGHVRRRRRRHRVRRNQPVHVQHEPLLVRARVVLQPHLHVAKAAVADAAVAADRHRRCAWEKHRAPPLPRESVERGRRGAATQRDRRRVRLLGGCRHDHLEAPRKPRHAARQAEAHVRGVRPPCAAGGKRGAHVEPPHRVQVPHKRGRQRAVLRLVAAPVVVVQPRTKERGRHAVRRRQVAQRLRCERCLRGDAVLSILTAQKREPQAGRG
ncbi:hypothetical protein DFJ73DRAFT_814960 [Zopfochytrium polystomum]|nr:hypothetical protein DFJ73DRAFT_814960 [Zopfochytrium polystomum]